jgi:hypothetical protein
MKHRNPLLVPIVLLTLLFSVLIIAGQIICHKSTSDYLTNISVEVLGAIITIIFIDFYLNKHEKRIADKREAIALTLLKPIIRSNFAVLFAIYKASTSQKGNFYKTKQLHNFINDNYIETISHFNILGDAPVAPTTSWTNHLRNEFSKLNNDYDSLLDKYSSTMTPELVETIENIKNSHFHSQMTNGLTIITSYTASQGLTIPSNLFEKVFTKEHIVEPYFIYLKQLLRLVENKEAFNNFFEIDEAQWRDNVAPKIGSSRLEVQD